MARKNSYIFTNKEHSRKGVMSTVLGMISIVSFILVLFFSYQNEGVAEPRYAVALFLATIFSLVGIVLGILSKLEADKFYLFSYMGILLNGLVLAGVGFVLYAGAYGI